MKRLLTFLLAGLLIGAFALPAFAWEFNMKGEYEYRLRYLSRTGDTDLFGVAPLQDSGINALLIPWVGFAGPNWYNRGAVNAVMADQATGVARITRGGYSRYGCDALYNDQRVTLQPEIRVNPAIRVYGVYTIGGIRQKYFQASNGTGNQVGVSPYERYTMFRTSMNAYDTSALGSWEQVRAAIQLPWGVLTYGSKDFPFGTGATLAYNTRADALLLVTPYGPWRWLWSLWLARGLGLPRESWATTPDKDNKWEFFPSVAFTYDSGPLNLGAAWVGQYGHLNRSQTNPTGQVPNAPHAADVVANFWMWFMKYNNGRFFASAEYSWIMNNIYNVGSAAAAPTVALTPPIHIEAYLAFAEVGAVAGPAKLRLLWAQSSGLDLTNAHEPGFRWGNPTKQYRPLAINYQALRPYQFLMFETYAGGNNGGWNATDVTFTSDDHGLMTDAYAFAARLDYAVAANLNVWGSYIWAHRLERNGAFAGGIASTGGPGNATAAAAQLWKQLNTGVAGLNPYVDDGYLGWEAGLGLDWKLLEGMDFHAQYNYWQPGDWFTQAYQAVGVQGGVVVDNALISGRDAIHSIIGSFVINF